MSGAESGSQGIAGELRREMHRIVRRWREPEAAACWLSPLLGVASAADPLFARLRTAVAADHAVPGDLLPGARSVVAFFIPFSSDLARENARVGPLAARSWAEAYISTNRLIRAIGDRMEAVLGRQGYRAAVTPATHNFDEERLLSRWSHKHVAFIAGLGTFGHHHQLITRAGCCGRLGSLVTDLEMPPTSRPGWEGCLVKAGQSCHACVARCRYGALFRNRFDRHACYRQCLASDAHHRDLGRVDVCGKCACGVPCSHEPARPTPQIA